MLDGGPSRVPQPIDNRRAAGRPAPVRREAQEPQPEDTGSRAVRRSPVPQNNASDQKSSKRILKSVIIVAIVLVVGAAGWLVWSAMRPASSAIDSDKYQAVFLTNGNTFFGKLQMIDDDQLKLTQVFYPEAGTADDLDPDSQEPQNPDVNTTRLIPFNEHIYGPEDEVVIDRQQLVFFMNLKSDGQVSKLIEEYKSSN